MSTTASKDQANHALMSAVQAGNLDAVNAALKAGADVNYKNSNGGVVDMTPLCRASCFGHTEVVKVLLRNGAKVNQRGLFGRTALHEAGCGGHLSVAALLREAAARLDMRDDDGQTPYNLAVSKGHDQLADLLKVRPDTRQVRRSGSASIPRSR